jgi:superfamily II DNA or RNA helicase
VAFHGELRPEQKAAADAMLAFDTGVLSATTAFGKTVVAAWLIAKRGVNTLVIVHRRQLLEQWVERLSTFLGLPSKAIGQIGGGRKKATRRLDVDTKWLNSIGIQAAKDVMTAEEYHKRESSFEDRVNARGPGEESARRLLK